MLYVFRVEVSSDEALDVAVASFNAALDNYVGVEVNVELLKVSPETWEEAGKPVACQVCGSANVAIHPAASPSFECKECGHVLG